MTARQSDPDSLGSALPTGVEADETEVLDLDTSVGLSAFGSEQSAESAAAAHASEASSRPSSSAGLAHVARPAVQSPSRRVEPVASVSRDPSPHVPLESSDGSPLAERTSAWPSHPALSSPAHVAPSLGRGWGVATMLALVLLSLAAGGIWWLRRSPPASARSGELTITSTPSGARVIIGGKDRGGTPLSLTLAPGPYDIELRVGGDRHMVPVRVTAGATTAQHVALPKPAPPSRGTLRIVSEPSAAAVAIDGRRSGSTPAVITDLPAGAHEVAVTGTAGTVRQRVEVSPDATTTVMVPLPKAAPPKSTGGWLSITAPTELQVFEGDRLLGTTRVNRLMLPTGPHTLHLSNEAAGVALTRTVTIEGGKTARLQIAVPPGTLSVNAVPWAAVSIDGRDAGETPLGGVELSPGTHEVVFTHPELGQRRQQVTVRSGAAARVSVDLRR